MAQLGEAMDVLVYDVADLRRLLGVGRPVAYQLMKRLGRRLGRRLVVSRVVLERWLASGQRRERQTGRSPIRRRKAGVT
jgi:hypothetical protein